MTTHADATLRVSAYTIPTDEPEADGTLDWASTTIVVVEAQADTCTGIGYTYAPAAAAAIVEDLLATAIRGIELLDVGAAWEAMSRALRNAGRSGMGWMALSAVDTALWDLKARLLDLPLVNVLDAVHTDVPIYGSGGFTTYTLERLATQLGGWADSGIPRVKMKLGRDPGADPQRLDAVREAIGADTELFVDANGAFGRKCALAWAERYADEWGVSWFEEPVSSDDLQGLALLRDRGPAGMQIVAGEYGYDLPYFRRMVDCVDVLQADVTRCAGITELLRVDGLCRAHGRALSLHCGPSIHLHPALALDRLLHLEYFHDHSRIEQRLFDGVVTPVDGALHPLPDRPGNGLEFKRSDAERYAA
jgi:L-alanine-DL-glutamate epimerase-like enolase superfamily enzyme